MKKILLTASTAALLCGCGGPNYSITGNAGLEPGDSVFLIGSGRTELAAGIVCADSTIRLKGRVAEPEIAQLADGVGHQTGQDQIQIVRLVTQPHPSSSSNRARYVRFRRTTDGFTRYPARR